MAGNLVVGMLVAAVAALVVVAVVRRLRDDLAQQGAANRDATVRAAVDSVVAIAADQLGVRAQAGTQELSLHRDAIGQRLTTMGDELTRVSELVGALTARSCRTARRAGAGSARHAEDDDRAGRHDAGVCGRRWPAPRRAGQWGERMADDVLRAAGLRRGRQLPQADGASPAGTDPRLHVPAARAGVVLHMDVKFPVDNYLRAPRGRRPTPSATRPAAGVPARRAQPGQGARTAAATSTPASRVDYVLLFIPNESVYGVHPRARPRRCVDAALRQKVVLCSPFTLFAVLGRDPPGRRQLPARADVRRDPRALAGFVQQWDQFTDQRRQAGQALDTVQRRFEELAGTRRRQLEKRLDEIDVLRTRHGLPGLDDDDEEPGDEPETPVLREVLAL